MLTMTMYHYHSRLSLLGKMFDECLIFPDPGMQIEHGLFISRMYQGGIIAKDGMLPSIGDRIVQVGGSHLYLESTHATNTLLIMVN